MNTANFGKMDLKKIPSVSPENALRPPPGCLDVPPHPVAHVAVIAHRGIAATVRVGAPGETLGMDVRSVFPQPGRVSSLIFLGPGNGSMRGE